MIGPAAAAVAFHAKKPYLCVIYKNRDMTTMIVSIKNGADAGNIALAVRQLKGVAKVEVQQEETFERIPGLPYTKEERIASVRRSMEDVRAGRVVTMEELRAKHPRI